MVHEKTSTGAVMRKTRRQFGQILSMVLFLGLSILDLGEAEAQSESSWTVSAGTHALTLPWYPGPVGYGFNPAVMVGTDRTIRSSEHWSFFYQVNLGFFKHHWWMSGVSLEPEIGIGRRLVGGFQADFRIGLGYMHYFWRRQSLELKEGKYVEATDWGRPSVILPLSVTLGYPGTADDPLSVSPFVSARWGLQGLFLQEVPALTHFQLLGGVRIQGDDSRPGPGGDR